MTTYFIGGSLGTYFGLLCWKFGKWNLSAWQMLLWNGITLLIIILSQWLHSFPGRIFQTTNDTCFVHELIAVCLSSFVLLNIITFNIDIEH